MQNTTNAAKHDISESWWGLKPTVTPCFGARLVQEGNHLHYLADRSTIAGTFSDAGISLCDAINFIVEKYDLVRTDRRGFNAETQSPLLTSIDILRARKAIGLMTRNDYKVVTDITTGKYKEVQ